MTTYLLRRYGAAKETAYGISDAMTHQARVTTHLRVDRRPVPDILIRWGCVHPSASAIQINTPEMLSLVNDKVASRRLLIDKGISVPRTFFAKQEAWEAIGAGIAPLIGRKTHHSQGLGMRVSRNALQLEADVRSTYWSEYIPKDKEYRVYTFFGRVLGVSEKVPKDPQAVSWNSSRDNGVFETIAWKHWPLDVTLLALKAAQAHNVDFSAVDIIKKGEDAYVLELNNAPQCSAYRQGLYARAFDWLIDEIETTGAKPPHRDLPAVIKTYKSMIHKSLHARGAAPAESAPEQG